MESPDFIVPPPGLIPSAPPSDEPDRTVRDAPPRTLPAFPPPPGIAIRPRRRRRPPHRRRPAPEERIEAPTATPQPGAWRLRVPGGLEVLLLRPVLLGRDPAPDPGRPQAAAIALDDPARSVSKTHALIEVVDGRVARHRPALDERHPGADPRGRGSRTRARTGRRRPERVDPAARRVRRATGSSAVELGVA